VVSSDLRLLLQYLKKWRVVFPNSQYLNNIGEEHPELLLPSPRSWSVHLMDNILSHEATGEEL